MAWADFDVGRLAVVTVFDEPLMECDTPDLVWVEVWTNDPEEPSSIWVRWSHVVAGAPGAVA